MKFTEEKLEEAFTGLLGLQGFPNHIGTSLVDARKPDEVLIEEEIKHLSDEKRDIEKRKKYEYWLDRGYGCCALANKEMAEALTNLIWNVQKEFKAGDEFGIDFEEKAFYDILKELCKKYDFTYPDDKLIDLSKAVKIIVDSQAKFPDWNKRDDIKSALKVELILVLDEFGYPPVERDEVYVEIFEQAENFKKNRQQ